MQELIDFIEKHWAVFSVIGAGILYLTKHLITNHQKVEVASAELAALKLKYESKVIADAQEVGDLKLRIDDYHVKAIAREQVLRREAEHLVDKARIDIGKEQTILERELRTDIREMSTKIDEGHKLLIQITADNKHTNETIIALLKHKEDQTKNIEEFWKEYGALLPALKILLKPKILNND